MTTRILTATALWLTTALVAIAQEGSNAPTMSPEGKGSKPSANALGGLQKDRPKGAKTEIVARDEATFDNTTNLAIFAGKVVVTDPQFKLYCDKLTVRLNKDRKGIDEAVADGSVVIIQENVDEKGKTKKSIGRSEKATFTPSTGDIKLEVSPQIQQDINNHIATEPGTIMILNRAGKLTTKGGSRTVIIDATSDTTP